MIWISAGRLKEVPEEAEASPVLPETIVEVLSAATTEGELAEKRELYLDEGAQEVWTCAEDGPITFCDEDGKSNRSVIIPSFPEQVD